MLVAILIIALILMLFLIYGWGSIFLIRKLFRIPAAVNIRFSLTLMAGMVLITWVAQGLSLFLPLSFGTFLFFLAVGVAFGILLIRSHEYIIKLPKSSYALGVILVTLVVLSALENCTHLPVNPDTGIYHAQAIRWIETYPAVPGLGNFHTRLAYNSSWLVLNALFSFSFLGVQSFHLVPASLTLIAVLDFSYGAISWIKGQSTFGNILRTFFLPLTFFVLGSQISSPGTDLPVILSIWIILAAWLDQISEDGEKRDLTSIGIFGIAVSLISIKLSAAPILILAVWIWVRNIKRPQVLAKLTGLAVVILLPWFSRNIILSGYLIYPFPYIDLFQVDWKIPSEVARDEIQVINAWARDPGASVQEVLAQPFLSWIRLWFIEKTRNQQIILIAAALSIFIFGVGLFACQKKEPCMAQRFKPLIIGYVTMAGGSVFWLLTAPDIRFGYGFLLGMLFIALTQWVFLIEKNLGRLVNLFRNVVIVGLIGYQAFFLFQSFDSKTLNERILFPLDYPDLPSEPCPLGNGQVWCAGAEAWTQCWYDPFPCIPQVNDWAELRGLEFRDGFRPKPK